MTTNLQQILDGTLHHMNGGVYTSTTVTKKIADRLESLQEKSQPAKGYSLQPPKPGFARNLRRAGFKIRIKHFRLAQLAVNPGFENGPAGIHLVTKENRKQYSHISSNGGMTEVDVTFPDGITTVGTAICCNEDTYNKRLGVYIAFQRAVEMRKKLTGK